jgi:hypothetical protein
MRQEYIVMGPARLSPVSDRTANDRPVLSSERAPYIKKNESNCKTKKIKIRSWAPKG